MTFTEKYPAIKIARLAVDKRYKRRGIGQNLLFLARRQSLRSFKTNRLSIHNSGCQNRESLDFYLKYEFKIVKKHEGSRFSAPCILISTPADKIDKQKGSVANGANAREEEKLKVRGIEALNKALGPERAREFLALIHCEPMCWMRISKMLYEGQSVEESSSEPKNMGEAEV